MSASAACTFTGCDCERRPSLLEPAHVRHEPAAHQVLRLVAGDALRDVRAESYGLDVRALSR